MKNIRLSHYFYICLSLFLALSLMLPGHVFDSAALTLFSVNSFLYGFYIAPILNGQKARIEELHKSVRAEANTLFAAALKTRGMKPTTHDMFVASIKDYCHLLYSGRKQHAEEKYEAIITKCLEYKGVDQEAVNKLLDILVQNQSNRSNISMQLKNKVYSNEWWIMFVLFGITLSFVLLISVRDNLFLEIVKALLCTGLTMLIIILIKLSTLTHKKAKAMWEPLRTLTETKFYRID